MPPEHKNNEGPTVQLEVATPVAKFTFTFLTLRPVYSRVYRFNTCLDSNPYNSITVQAFSVVVQFSS